MIASGHVCYLCSFFAPILEMPPIRKHCKCKKWALTIHGPREKFGPVWAILCSPARRAPLSFYFYFYSFASSMDLLKLKLRRREVNDLQFKLLSYSSWWWSTICDCIKRGSDDFLLGRETWLIACILWLLNKYPVQRRIYSSTFTHSDLKCEVFWFYLKSKPFKFNNIYITKLVSLNAQKNSLSSTRFDLE